MKQHSNSFKTLGFLHFWREPFFVLKKFKGTIVWLHTLRVNGKSNRTYM
jgi:hypothetical protein